ncbi:MAG: HRDC domain-containing protein, partial [Ilumatobacteraceae bacterium]
DDAPAPPPPDLRRARVDPLADLRAWRAAVARAAGIDDRAVCSDSVLQSLAASPPSDTADLAQRLGITVTAAARLRPLPGSTAAAG